MARKIKTVEEWDAVLRQIELNESSNTNRPPTGLINTLSSIAVTSTLKTEFSDPYTAATTLLNVQGMVSFLDNGKISRYCNTTVFYRS